MAKKNVIRLTVEVARLGGMRRITILNALRQELKTTTLDDFTGAVHALDSDNYRFLWEAGLTKQQQKIVVAEIEKQIGEKK